MLSLLLAFAPGITLEFGDPILINEIRIDQSGGDNDEYFELIGTAGASLDGLTYIVIGDGSGGSGVIESISNLSNLSLPADGIFLVGEGSMTIGAPDAVMSLGFENGDNVTHMLVEGFSGSSQQDVDTDDDGTFDVTPWLAIVDSVSLVETPTSGDQYYSSNTVGPDGSNVPGHVLVCDGTWEIGSWDFTNDTPGDANNCGDPFLDCNNNGIDDSEDIATGFSDDCDVNGIPDECENLADCNANGVADDCDISNGSSNDCDGNGVPDDCEIADGTHPDCNSNGVPDICDISAGTSTDSNSNGVPDECEFLDCNNNGTDDSVDISSGTSDDCDANGIPDECESLADCNSNGVADACDISSGTSTDTNGNGIPDDCKGSSPDVTINELRVDQSGSDNDEYVELSAAPGTVLDGLSYIVIGDGSGGAGSVECAFDITGTVGDSGLFLIAEDTFTLGTPDQTVSTADYQSSLAFENGDNVTHMLVFAFGGAFGDDVDADDDGTMDYTPWLDIVDSVALIVTTDPSDGDFNVVYSPNQVGPNGNYLPAHVYSCGGSWAIGDFGLGDDTPGGPNYACDPTVYAMGLRSPMGMDIAADGSVWVAQAGSGGVDPPSAANDAGVSRIDGIWSVEGVVEGLPSITAEGFSSGSSDVAFDSAGTMVVAQGGGVDPLSFSALEFDVSTWASGDPAQGSADVVTQWDVGTYSVSQGFIDTNPNGVAEGSDGNLYVVDSGANAIIKVERATGTMSVFATFPDVAQPDPIGPPFTNSVPTRILAHDDGFYVVNLTGFPFNDGAASVFDLDYAGNVTEIATGLSRATDVAVDPRDGSLYATQFTAFDVTMGPPWVWGTGAVVRVNGTDVETVANVLSPTGIAIDWDGTMYVSSLITGCVHRFESNGFPGVVYCSGDAASCPCGNAGDGTSGCANSSGAGATLTATGSASILADDLVLNFTGGFSGQPCLFFQGENRVNGGNGIVFGDGLRCAGFGVVRLEIVTPDINGDASTSVSIATKGGVSSGDVRHYQVWNRDNVGVCGYTFNTSNGYSLIYRF